jgi:hypothetical protein
MLQKIHRRYIILLIGALSLACFSLIIVTFLILQNQPVVAGEVATPTGPTPTPGPQPTHTVTFVQITGLGQYPLAEAAAKSWATDAQLVSANADWPQILSIEQMGTPTTWNYRFYSPTKERLFFVLVEPDGQLRTVEHQIKVTLPPKEITMDSWGVDSAAALAVWLDYGGSKLLRSNPGLEVVAQLRMMNNNPNPVWIVVGFDRRTEDVHVIVVDANQGAVVTTSPEEQ